VTRRAGSDTTSARTTEMIAEVSELICSQEDKLDTSKSSHQIGRQLSISVTLVRRNDKVEMPEYLGHDCMHVHMKN